MPVKKKSKIHKLKIYTCKGILSYPQLTEPDEGREFSDGKYKTDFLISKADWKTSGKELRDAVLEVGRAYFKDRGLELSDFKNPFRDTDKMEKYSASPRVKGCILIRPKSDYKPVIVNAQREEMSESEVKAIKGGDIAHLVVVVYPYSTGDGGVTLGLNAVQWVQAGEALGGGAASTIAMIQEVEVDAEVIDPDEESEDEEAEEETEEDTEEEETEEEAEDEAPKKRGRPKKVAVEIAAKSKKKSSGEEEEFNFDDE